MISFFCICLLGLSISFIYNPYWLSIDTCLDNGQVWDYQKNICRDDCLIWKKEFGCIKLTPEQTKLLKQCKNLSNCPDNQTFKEICLSNQKAWNINNNDCKFDFISQDCSKLSGNWEYPTICGSSSKYGARHKKNRDKPGFFNGGSDEARTRDPMRDRHVF